MVDIHWRGCTTFGYILYTLPRRIREDQSLECNLDVGMVLPNPHQDLCRLLEGQNGQEVFWSGAGVAHDGGS